MDRSCEFCKWRTENELLVGVVNWCAIQDKEVQPDDYCLNFNLRKTER